MNSVVSDYGKTGRRHIGSSDGSDAAHLPQPVLDALALEGAVGASSESWLCSLPRVRRR
jgi:hypothetical protein